MVFLSAFWLFFILLGHILPERGKHVPLGGRFIERLKPLFWLQKLGHRDCLSSKTVWGERFFVFFSFLSNSRFLWQYNSFRNLRSLMYLLSVRSIRSKHIRLLSLSPLLSTPYSQFSDNCTKATSAEWDHQTKATLPEKFYCKFISLAFSALQ